MTEQEKLDKLIEKLNSALSIAGSEIPIGQRLSDIEPILKELWGCTDPQANNWNPEAIYDDGSCEYWAEQPPEG